MKTEWLYAVGTIFLVFFIAKRVVNLRRKEGILLIIKHSQYMSIMSGMLFILMITTIFYDLTINNQTISESFRDMFLAALFLWLTVSFYNNYKITQNGLVLANNPLKWEDIVQWGWQNNNLILNICDDSMKRKGKTGVAKILINEKQKHEVEKYLSDFILNKKTKK